MSTPLSLTSRHTDATQKLILDAAVALLERDGVPELTVRAVAREAGMSERTVFRYHAAREALLDAVASDVSARLDAPAPPASIAELIDYPRVLFARFEEVAALMHAAMHTEIFERMRRMANPRWRAVERLLGEHASHRSAHERKLAAGRINYVLTATTWRYFRVYFGFPLTDAVEAATKAVQLTLDELAEPGRSPPARKRRL
jgi:AcrR family transcriptional regulator